MTDMLKTSTLVGPPLSALYYINEGNVELLTLITLMVILPSVLLVSIYTLIVRG